MSKPLLGLVIGAVLGLIDGLSALLYPGTASMIVPIVIGSTVKGLVTGTAMGFLARRVRSVTVGILGGLVLGLALSYMAALTPDPQGGHHFVEIMLPVSPDGATIGTTSVLWVAPPHFYRSDKLVVLYVGRDEKTVAALRTILGNPMAGAA